MKPQEESVIGSAFARSAFSFVKKIISVRFIPVGKDPPDRGVGKKDTPMTPRRVRGTKAV
jgi:hypothetical protein